MITFSVTDTVQALNGGLFVSPGFGTHPVRVIDSYELMFVTQDSLDFFEADRHYHLDRNQTLLLYPGLRHGGLLPYTPNVNFYWAHFRTEIGNGEKSGIRVPKTATVRNPEAMVELFCRFVSDQESNVLDPCSGAQLIALMLCMISCDEPAVRPLQVGPRRIRVGTVEKIHRYIDVRYRRPITTSVIAHDLGFNPDYLERVFFARERISIIDAIHQKRISAAKAALHTDVRKNIDEIARSCGYTDVGYFRRMFKRLNGLTPREFRSLYSRTHINTH